jgi:hypothetical protein
VSDPAELSARESLITIAALAALAYMTADVVHEAIGHGGACWLAGGRIMRLSSAFFRCSPGLHIVDAAGPIANLVVAGLCLLALRWCRGCRPSVRMFLLLTGVFDLFWPAAQMIYSAILNRDDWAFALNGLVPGALWRPALVVLGAALYSAGLMAVRREIPPHALRPVLVAYAAAGVTACAAAAFHRLDPLGAVRECALETFAANAGLLFVLRRPQGIVAVAAPAAAVPSDVRWIAAAVIVFALFAASLGRGL